MSEIDTLVVKRDQLEIRSRGRQHKGIERRQDGGDLERHQGGGFDWIVWKSVSPRALGTRTMAEALNEDWTPLPSRRTSGRWQWIEGSQRGCPWQRSKC